jgi:hypothetical protein
MPTDAPSVVRTFSLPAQTLAKLDAIAQRTGRTRASMLAYLITIAEPTGFPRRSAAGRADVHHGRRAGRP